MSHRIHPLLVAVIWTLMLAALLWSRAALGMLQVAWGIIAFAQLKNSAVYVLKSSLFRWSIFPIVLYAILGISKGWSNTDSHLITTLSMLPVVAISIHAFPDFWQQDYWKQSWVIIACVSTILPLQTFIQSFHQLSNLYGSGRVANVWMEGDHVRYSLFIGFGIFFLLNKSIFGRTFHAFFSAYLVAFLFILGVRTGWMTILVIGVFHLVKSLSKQTHKKMILLVPILCVLVAATWLIPSIQRKIDYTLYQWKSVPEAELINYSDGTRKIVNAAAIHLIEQKETGVGWSKMENKIHALITKQYPHWKTGFSWPFNQWLFWIVGGGWIFAVLLGGWLFYPGIIQKGPHIIPLLIIALSCLVESTLNYQYGIWLLAWGFMPLWQLSTKRH